MSSVSRPDLRLRLNIHGMVGRFGPVDGLGASIYSLRVWFESI